jgi:hypothetical protein
MGPSGATSSLLETLEQEVRSILDAAKVFDIASCGWLNANDPDPEFIGHAMWQVDQPGLDHAALFGEQPVRQCPGALDDVVLGLGEDFTGMMQASRLSIGLSLLWHQQARGHLLGQSPFYWLHHTDALLKLAIASDRLRDLLIVACTGASPSSYKGANQRNRRFATPFKEGKALLEARGLPDGRLIEAALLLPPFGEQLFSYIDRRNRIVHEVATRMAKLMRESVSELRERFDRERLHGFTPGPMPEDEAAWSAAEETRTQELHSEIDDSLQEVVDWYRLLVHASNAVFQVEYWSRTLAR